MERDLAVCRGIRTLTRNCLCSDLRGRAKPFMILENRSGEERRGEERRGEERRGEE